MFKKLINKIIMATKTYQRLKFELTSVSNSLKAISDEILSLKKEIAIKEKCVVDLEDNIANNKTVARRIIRLANLFDKKKSNNY